MNSYNLSRAPACAGVNAAPPAPTVSTGVGGGNFDRCPHCVHGFAEDHSHPTERRLKECEFCRGTGRIPDPTAKPVEFDREAALGHSPDDEADGIRHARRFQPQHWGT